MFRLLKSRLRGWFTRDAVMTEIRDELQHHEERLAEQLERDGLPPAVARAEARRRIGNPAILHDSGYDVRGGGLIEAVAQDVSYAVRRLRANPGFTIVALVTLALGIGANTAIFSIASGVLLQPPPFEDPGRLVMVWNDNSRISEQHDWHSYPNYVDYRDRSTVFAGLSAFNVSGWTLTGAGSPERIAGCYATANLFDVLGVRPLYGRTFTREEDLGGATNVVAVSYGFWQRHFGGRRDTLGQSIVLNGLSRTVVGIMPKGFAYPEGKTELWVPIPATEYRSQRSAMWLQVIGRLEPGVSVARAQEDVNRVNADIQKRVPQQAGYGVFVESYADHVVGRVRPAILILLGAVACVLLIACTNVANLLLARGATREREMALRAAIGAGRGRLVRQLLTESLVLAVLGGVAGGLLGWWCLHLLLGAAPPDLPRIQAIGIDGRVLAFTALAAMLTGIAFGLMPAVQTARTSPGAALKEGARGSSGGGVWIRRTLVVAEVALAVVLLVGAGLMIRSYQTLQRVDLGFRTDHVLTGQVLLQGPRYTASAATVDFYHQLTTRLAALPGVQGAAAIGTIFLTATPASTNFSIEGRPDFRPEESVEVPFDGVTPTYFSVMRVPLLAGRTFTEADSASAPRVVIINETMARRFWPGENPIGRRMKYGRLDDGAPWMTIVGVVADTRRTGYDAVVRPETYLPYAQNPDSIMTVVVRTTGDPASTRPSLEAIVRALDPQVAVQHVQPLETVVSGMTAQRRLNTILLGGFAVVATLLALVGLYGVMAYSVQQRTRELGVRLALGATGSNVMQLVLKEGLQLVAIGLVVGLAAAVASSSLLSKILYHVDPTDPVTLASIALMTLIVSTMACAVPALRAWRVDPVTALRAE
jgi:putative ABC transport system permease protein